MGLLHGSSCGKGNFIRMQVNRSTFSLLVSIFTIFVSPLLSNNPYTMNYLEMMENVGTISNLLKVEQRERTVGAIYEQGLGGGENLEQG